MMNKRKIIDMAKSARKASYRLSELSIARKRKALVTMAKALINKKKYILSQNKIDLANAKRNGLSKAMVERLMLDDKRIRQMTDSLKQVSRLKSYVGEIISSHKRPNGLVIDKVRVAIGVIFIIFESRPNVTSDCMGLSLMSSNVVILKGGSEAINSNLAIFNVLAKAAYTCGVPKNSFNILATTDRKIVDTLLNQYEDIDLVIPRGGESLISAVVAKSKIPVIKHYKGVCHLYVDKTADLNMAEKITLNAKLQRPGVCNAIETLLIHKDIAKKFLATTGKKLLYSNVKLRGCQWSRKYLKSIKKATLNDWSTEYLDLILSIKVVGSLNEAIEHINTFGSHHSDAIVTKNKTNAELFLKRVDSACVYVNASTRFTDGYEFGMGAEIGISTDRLHARGPMALEELTTYKYVIRGSGQIRK